MAESNGMLDGLFGHTIRLNGANLTQRTFLNFTGIAFTATDNPTTNSTDISASGLVPSLTESGTDPSTSGWINYVAASAGVYGGISGGGEAIQWKWDGAARTITAGDIDANVFAVTISGAQIALVCATQNRFFADSGNTSVAAPAGSNVLSITDTDYQIVIGGKVRCAGNASLSTVTSPDGTSCTLTLSDSQAALDGAVRTVVSRAGDERLVAAATKTTLLGPSGTISVELDSLVLAVAVPSQSTVGAAGAASALPATPSGYLQITINGNAKVIPYYNP